MNINILILHFHIPFLMNNVIIFFLPSLEFKMHDVQTIIFKEELKEWQKKTRFKCMRVGPTLAPFYTSTWRSK